MRVSFLQYDIQWGNVNENLQTISKLVSNRSPFDLLVLPEMYATGFNFQPDLAALRLLKEVPEWQKKLSKQLNCIVAGSNLATEGKNRYNRLLFTYPDGRTAFYDKRHLFTHADEHKVFKPGNNSLIVESGDWRITGFICYDLRFPVWTRNVHHLHLQLFVANWPKSRHRAWEILLQARAVENQCYVVGVNRLGIDMKGIEYKGGSMIIDPLGNVLCDAAEETGLFATDLSIDFLTRLRTSFPVLDDADDFTIFD